MFHVEYIVDIHRFSEVVVFVALREVASVMQILNIESEAQLEIHHKWLLSSDAHRLSVVEIVSETGVKIQPEVVCQHELHSDSGSYGVLHSLHLLFHNNVILGVLYPVTI